MFESEIIVINRKIEELLKTKQNIIIAIDGKCGSGKSTLGKIISERFNGNLFHMDDFYLTKELITKERMNEPGGNVDYIRFEDEVLKNLIQNIDFNYNIYNCKNLSFSKSKNVILKKINIVEGSYSLHPNLINYYDIKIFLEVSSETQLDRIEKRSNKLVLKNFIEKWIPLENYYFESFKIKDKSDILFDTSN